jgi:hypothetical protein
MGYGHYHLSLSCHERRRKKKLERVALERAHLTSQPQLRVVEKWKLKWW